MEYESSIFFYLFSSLESSVTKIDKSFMGVTRRFTSDKSSQSVIVLLLRKNVVENKQIGSLMKWRIRSQRQRTEWRCGLYWQVFMDLNLLWEVFFFLSLKVFKDTQRIRLRNLKVFSSRFLIGKEMWKWHFRVVWSLKQRLFKVKGCQVWVSLETSECKI